MIGVMSALGSNGRSLCNAGAVENAAVLIISVWPSGLARASSAVPIIDPAPGRFSTTMGWLQTVSSSVARARAVRSVAPPGL